ncbi:Bifunctional riboflavin biosynthesis protein RIBA 1 [Phytophthora nicotianae]|uniref:Bifunctional riboflavin biosynthesis protein RIBA 1 n=1 Tax=Phytophthora nicotianae TaxID=4792 RepID=A0A0W8CT88_PHYNI|nr:Bifunctional riboflavin biosynthesis protein RIBA 1 [Phytophthora nicotianae]
MQQLRYPNNAAQLSKFTPLLAKTRNVTRWSSTYEMLERYAKLRVYARQIEAVEDSLPSTSEHKKLCALLVHLTKLDSVCKRLQSDTTSMGEVRLLFDSVLLDYPIMGEYLKTNSKIVHSPIFENGLVKLALGRSCRQPKPRRSSGSGPAIDAASFGYWTQAQAVRG